MLQTCQVYGFQQYMRCAKETFARKISVNDISMDLTLAVLTTGGYSAPYEFSTVAV